jgi:hypothetical protein
MKPRGVRAQAGAFKEQQEDVNLTWIGSDPVVTTHSGVRRWETLGGFVTIRDSVSVYVI